MSHFIQDNQAVVELANGELMLFIKGGDNNVTSFESNRRTTSWSFQHIFTSKNDYDSFIEDIVITDVSGGSWQFQSLKNKYFEGFLGYFATVFNRFEKAYNSRIVSSLKLEDVTVTNIKEFEYNLMKLFREKNYLLKDQDGCEQDNIGIVTYHKGGFMTVEEYGFNKLQQRRYTNPKNLSGKVRELCMKYEKITPKEAVSDVIFCRRFVEAEIEWFRGTSLLERIRDEKITRNVDFACFNILLNSSEKTVKDLLNVWDIKNLIKKYPSQFETLATLSTFQDRAKRVIEEEETVDKFRENFKAINEADYKTLIKEIDEVIQRKLETAVDEFVKAWNSIENESWYKNTNEKFPILKNKLDELYATNTFTLESIKDLCNGKIDELIYNYNHQLKKNQRPIKTFTAYIIKQYHTLIDEKTLDELCEFFKLKKPQTVSKIVVEAPQETSVSDEEKKQLSLFDFAS